MLRRRQRRAQAGDTIVEVMVVLAVLGMAIGISYATANRSLLNARQAQESSQATELIKSQAEQLRSLAADGTIYTAQQFCVTGAGVTMVSSGNCNLGEASRYAVTIDWAGAASDTFIIRATWDDVIDQGKDTATLAYRVHKP